VVGATASQGFFLVNWGINKFIVKKSLSAIRNDGITTLEFLKLLITQVIEGLKLLRDTGTNCSSNICSVILVYLKINVLTDHTVRITKGSKSPLTHIGEAVLSKEKGRQQCELRLHYQSHRPCNNIHSRRNQLNR